MRILSPFEQEERRRKLLQAVIHEYIKTGKPVGSVTLVEHYNLGLSSATIRNIMAELENDGYLGHPHTSAGRVPTDKAYRYYVDAIVELQRLALMERERIQREYEARIGEIDELMVSTSKTLSALSEYSGFALLPNLDQSRLQYIKLVPMDPYRLLVVLVADSGVVKNRVVVFDEVFPKDYAEPLSVYLAERLTGKSFREARDSLVGHIEDFGRHQDQLIDWARRVTEQAFQGEESGSSMYLEGTGNILSLPDFQDHEEIRHLVQFLDEKQALGDLLTKDLSKSMDNKGRWEGVQVKIGAETNIPDFKNLSLVSSSYSINGRQVGVLGIIGPKRMEYSKMISLVGYVSKVVSQVLGKLIR